MERICLDSDVALDFLKGERSIVEKLQYYANREEVCIDALTAVELATIVKKSRVIDEFFNSVTILPFDRKSAQLTMRMINDLKETGHRPSMSSLHTASICMANNAFLFTKDRSKFEGIKGLRLV